MCQLDCREELLPALWPGVTPKSTSAPVRKRGNQQGTVGALGSRITPPALGLQRQTAYYMHSGNRNVAGIPTIPAFLFTQ